jgi:hypothetical protein
MALWALVFAASPAPADQMTATVYKSPACGCCAVYTDYLRENGFEVRVKDVEGTAVVKRMFGIRPELQSCHTSLIDGYVVEGHVPVETIRQLLEERPDIRGISLPGMPTGVPGMPGPRSEPLIFYTIEDSPKEFGSE